MRIAKKVICLLLSLALLLPLAACSNDNITVAKYKDTTVDSGMLSYMLSSQKAYIEQMMYYYYQTTDFDAMWATEYSRDENGNVITFADNAFDGIINALKMFVVIKQLCKEYGVTITDESTIDAIEGYVSEDAAIAGDINFLEIALAEYGATVDHERDYLYTTSLTSPLIEYLYGDNGTMKIPDSEIRAEFDKTYTKIDMNMFSYTERNESGSYVNRVDSNITDEELKEYFDTKYVKAEHILFYFYDTSDTTGNTKISEAAMAEKREKANALFEKIKKGEISFDEAKAANNEDKGLLTTEGGDLIGKGSLNEKFTDFENAIFDMEIGSVSMIETDMGIHIVRRNALTDGDYTGSKENVAAAITKNRIAAEANEFFGKMKNGEAVIDAKTTYGSYQEAFLFGTGELGTEAEKVIAELKPGEAAIYEDDSCTVVFRRLETTDDDYKAKYSTIRNSLNQEAFYQYIESLYPQVELNEEEISKYTFAAVKSLNIQSYIK